MFIKLHRPSTISINSEGRVCSIEAEEVRWRLSTKVARDYHYRYHHRRYHFCQVIAVGEVDWWFEEDLLAPRRDLCLATMARAHMLER